MKTDEIHAVATALCEHGARAVARYVEVSDLDPAAMPEYFMPAFILEDMGNEVKMTPETSLISLLEWNMNTKGGQPTPQSIADIKHSRSPRTLARLVSIS